MYTFWGYFRSSAAYRVRIALNLKDIAHERKFVHLAKGEQTEKDFKRVNPQGLLPVLQVAEGDKQHTLIQSMAILEYLEESYPEPALLPKDPLDRARVRAIAGIVACDIHPLNNLRVLNYLKGPMHQKEDAMRAWYAHWVDTGFGAIEEMVSGSGFCFGGTPTMADVCLIPQIFNAKRFEVDLYPFPKIRRIDENCARIEAFAAAHPDRQPDAA
jgi:maleylacetoacetate isomerase